MMFFMLFFMYTQIHTYMYYHVQKKMLYTHKLFIIYNNNKNIARFTIHMHFFLPNALHIGQTNIFRSELIINLFSVTARCLFLHVLIAYITNNTQT